MKKALSFIYILMIFTMLVTPLTALAQSNPISATPYGSFQSSSLQAGIVDVVSKDPRFKTLLAAVQAAGLVDTLKGNGPFTVFAPTDQAFARLPKGTVDNLLKPENKEMLKNILLYHVASGKLMAADVVKKSLLEMASGQNALIQVNGNKAKINGANIIATDVKVDNGVIHVIDAVILPPKDIASIAAGDSRFKTLVAAVNAAGLMDTLKGNGTFTLFAPTDQAFAKLPKGTVETLLKPENQDKLKGILLYHVAKEILPAAELVKRNLVDTVQGSPVIVESSGGRIKIDGANVVVSDILASNGIIHVIDNVILPPSKDIADTAAADGRFKTLLAAVQAAGLSDTLKGMGPFTVFAPTDQAFAKLPKGTVDTLLKPENKELLASILAYHVVSGTLTASDVASRVILPTVQGQPLKVQLKGGKVMINNASIILTNIRTTNGIIHVIDTVVLPPSKDLVDTAISDGRFKTLVAAVQAAGLADALKGKGPFTVFAPTDQAFAKLPKGTLATLLKPENKDQLKNILLYHVANNKLYSSDVVGVNSVDTLLGKALSVKVQNGKVMINGAQVIVTDILTTNGVIHVIDTVLIPPK